jgi:hypothetical protein
LERIVHSAERLEMIEALKQMPRMVEAEVAQVPESVLRWRPEGGDWSMKEVVGHMREQAEIWHKRLYMVHSQPDPMLPAFDGPALVREHNYQDGNLADALAGFRQARAETVELVEHTVDWSRLGRHPEIGRRTFRQWVENLIDLELSQLERLRMLKRAATGSGTPA